LHGAKKSKKPMLTTLADLLAPVSLSEFLDAFRGRKRLHIAATDPTRAESLFSWRDIDTLLSERALDENVMFLRDGVRVPRQLYTSNEGKRLNVPAFHNLLTQGVSIVVNNIHRSVFQIGQLAAAIERTMGIETNVNAYLGFTKGSAFKPHSDIMDVLVVQIHGNKQWDIWNLELPHPIERADGLKVNTSVAPDQEVALGPGDVLFIPRGEPHCAAISAGRSVHLTIGLLSKTGIDFLDHLRKEALKDPFLRVDLPRHTSKEQSAAQETELKNRLHQLIGAASMVEFLEKDDLSRLPIVQTVLAGESPQTDNILRLTLRRRVPLPDVPPDGPAQPVIIGGEARRLSPPAIDILRRLFDQDFMTWRALHAELTARHRQALIAEAIQDLQRLGFITVN
jgi:ribosomal protein L16 Arg81 hydroxylase